MSRILIVEDSEVTQAAYREALRDEHELSFATSVAAALAVAVAHDFDLMLIDLTLPDGDGFQFCKQLAAGGRELPPFIFISGRYDIQDKLTGFALGAEDYVVKPFDSKELKARVDIRLKRRGPLAAPIKPLANIQGLRIDPQGLKAYKLDQGAERDLGLTPNELRLLQLFLVNEDKVLTRGELLAAGWGGDVHVLERTVDRHVSGLRRKLGSLGGCLEAVPGQGYLWRTAARAAS